MSQQINLLPEERHAISPLTIALIVWGLVGLALFAAWSINKVRLAAAREAETAAALELKEGQAQIQQRRDRGVALAADIEAIRPVAEAARHLINLSADLGSSHGYSAYFSTLASITEDGLWLTDIAITKSGKSIQIGGQSLNSDAVMRLSQSLNAAFSDKGVTFTSVELTPQSTGTSAPVAPSPGVPGDSKPPMTSTKFVIR